jgi:hypothetical protein
MPQQIRAGQRQPQSPTTRTRQRRKQPPADAIGKQKKQTGTFSFVFPI